MADEHQQIMRTVNIAAGIEKLKAIGYDYTETRMVIELALMRWARGEEEQAEKGAIEHITFNSWRRVLVAATEDRQFGSCPVCGARGERRERRPNGNDECAQGHTYPTRDAIPNERSK